MSLETQLHTALTALCARTFPIVAPFSTTRPYITWQQVGGAAVEYQEGTLPDLRNGMVQINVWADTYADAVTLALQIEAALSANTDFQCSAEGAHIAEHDEDTKRYGTRQDFSIWATR
jgi:hypothetical protein